MCPSDFLTYVDIGKETLQTKTCTICLQNEEQKTVELFEFYPSSLTPPVFTKIN